MILYQPQDFSNFFISLMKPCEILEDLSRFWQNIHQIYAAGSEINFFGRRQLATDIFFFQLPNGKMWSLKSVSKTFPLQRNTSQNYWSPQACRQNICNWCNQESSKCWNHLLTTLTDLHCHFCYQPKGYKITNRYM